MRWLRPSRADTYESPAVDEVARTLEAAAAEAPDSPRMAEIRAWILEEAATPRPMVLAPALGLATVVLLAVVGVVAVGAPAVGSYLDGTQEPGPPVTVAPALDDKSKGAKDLGAVDQKGTEKEVAETAAPAATPVEAAVPPASASASPTPAAPASPSVSPTPTQTPDPPGILPTPPIPIPTPPVVPSP